MNYYDEIKSKILKCEIYDKIKNYSKDRNKIKNYFEIGKILSEAGKEYGKNIIKEYSNKLTIEIGKKYNERNLRYMRKFYELFVNQNWNTMCSNLTWSHYREVNLKNINQDKTIGIIICKKENRYVIEYCSDDRIISREYELV